jgi:hypothetical protein
MRALYEVQGKLQEQIHRTLVLCLFILCLFALTPHASVHHFLICTVVFGLTPSLHRNIAMRLIEVGEHKDE